MSSKFEECKTTGYIEKVSAGEVCSLAVAKSMGVDDIVNNNYYKRQYVNVKTFNKQKDLLENRSSFQFCTPTTDEKKAFPLCPLQEGAGFGFTMVYDTKTRKNVCATSECPTSFKQQLDGDGVPRDPMKCIKPRTPKTSPLGKQIDERWYDWFTIQDYHLGNKYSSSNGINYKPCQKGSVPLYTTDPVDGLTVSFDVTLDKLDRCVKKNDYFGGKYADGSSYCPVAWIVRAGATKKDYGNIYEDMLDKLEDTGKPTASMDTLKKNIATLVEKDIYNPIQKYGFSEFIGPPLSDEVDEACKVLLQDKERVNIAYNICKTLQEDPEKFKEKLIVENQTTPAKADIQFKRTRQACHAVFCDPTGPGLAQIDSGEPVCYPDVELLNNEKEILAAEKEEKEATKPLAAITSDAEKAETKRVAFKGAIQMIKTVLIIIALLFLYYKVWPFIKYIYETKIKPLFSRHAKSSIELQAEEALEKALMSTTAAPVAPVASVASVAAPKAPAAGPGKRKK